jgi:pentatricopeptide repeat protein
MKRNGVQPDIATYNNLLWAISRHCYTLDVWAILDDMLLHGIQPNAATFAAIFNVFLLLLFCLQLY